MIREARDVPAIPSSASGQPDEGDRVSFEFVLGLITDLVGTKGSSNPIFGDVHKGIARIGAVAAAATGQLISSTVLVHASNGAAVTRSSFVDGRRPRFGVGVLPIQLLIWKFSDNELQSWCAHCAFGTDKSKRTTGAKLQMSALEDALKETMQ